MWTTNREAAFGGVVKATDEQGRSLQILQSGATSRTLNFSLRFGLAMMRWHHLSDCEPLRQQAKQPGMLQRYSLETCFKGGDGHGI
jgi:hypothetical protein